MPSSPRAILLALAIAAGVSPALAQDQRADEVTIQVAGGKTAARLLRAADGGMQYAVSTDGVTFTAPTPARYELLLRYAQFDPLRGEPAIAATLRAPADQRLFIVQYHTQGLEDYRVLIEAMGAENLLFLANHANVYAMDAGLVPVVQKLPWVRAVVPFHPAYKLDERLHLGLAQPDLVPARLELALLVARRGGVDHAAVSRFVHQRGGRVLHSSEPTFLMEIELGSRDLVALAARNDVTWVEPMGRPEEDMDIARGFHGANYVETIAGMTGQGVRVEVMDGGTDTTHPDLANHAVHSPINSASSHGTCTSGIVVGTGAGNASARGGAPSAFLSVASYSSFAGGSRYAHSVELQNAALSWQCVLQSNSWGSTLTTAYNTTSQNMDLILFDQARLSILNSQSNQGSQSSRPEAWAKNIISVGGIKHMNTATRADDNWTSGASIGPAADGRIKPDIASFYDSVLTCDVVGAGGYSSTNYYSGFNGTSAATPVTAGHLTLFYQMWHAGLFGNTPGASVFDSRPQNTTAKAILINTATQWTFSGTTHDLTRTHQGWGGADLKTLYDRAASMLVVDESVVLGNLQANAHPFTVAAGATELKVTLVFRDPPGTVSSSQHRINNLDLRATSPTGVIYHGNNGLLAGLYSTAGGSPNTIDTVECVIVANPEVGAWTFTVTAAELNQDAHVETPALDADYALVASVGSGTVVPPPAAPTGLAATGGTGQISLSWVDNATDETSYLVERSSDGTSFAQIAALGANATGYVDAGLGGGVLLWYRVRCANAGGNSGYSNTASATTASTAIDLVPNAQVAGHGTVSGGLADVQAADGVYQSITETTTSRRNSLQHEWQVPGVPTTGTRTVRFKGYRTASTDGDTFPFQYLNGSTWTALFTVQKTVDDGVFQTFALPAGIGGTVRIRVIDGNNTRNAVGLDTIFVDQLAIRVN